MRSEQVCHDRSPEWAILGYGCYCAREAGHVPPHRCACGAEWETAPEAAS